MRGAEICALWDSFAHMRGNTGGKGDGGEDISMSKLDELGCFLIKKKKVRCWCNFPSLSLVIVVFSCSVLLI